MNGLTGRTVIITGGAKGIGRGIAARLLREGMSVVLWDNAEPALLDAQDELRALGRLSAFPVDVADEASVRAGIEHAQGVFGNLHGLVNNAGIAMPDTGPVERLSRERWDRVLAVNLTGPMLCAKHATPALRAAGGGAIVNIASVRAHQVDPQNEAYASSKGGLLSLTFALAVSLGPDIRVNAISPGWIETASQEPRPLRKPVSHSEADRRQHPAGRIGDPEDIAALTAFLLSDDARFITGQEFIADGGINRVSPYI